MTTYKQIKYYRGVVLPKIAEYKKKNLSETADILKEEYFGGSTRIWEPIEFEEILKMIREDFSKYTWIPLPNEEDIPPNFYE